MKSWTAIALGVVAIAAGAWWLISSQSDDAPAADSGASASTTTAPSSTTGAPATTTAAPPPEQPAIEIDVEGVIGEFGELWVAGDWAGMSRIATEGVVAVAQEWGPLTSVAAVTAEGCGLDDSGSGTCGLLVIPVEGRGLIFRIDYAIGADTGLVFDDLIFNGDAG